VLQSLPIFSTRLALGDSTVFGRSLFTEFFKMNTITVRAGEIYECEQCRALIEIIRGSEWPPLQSSAMRCCCGNEFVLLQSGSESVSGSPAGLNKILQRHVSLR
jgi:hypothetical protein